MLSIFSFKTSTPLKKLFLSICRDILCNCANIWPKEHKYARLKSDLMKEEFTRIRTIGPPNWRLVYQNEREMLIKIWTTKMEFCHYLPINWLWCKGPGKCPCLRVWLPSSWYLSKWFGYCSMYNFNQHSIRYRNDFHVCNWPNHLSPPPRPTSPHHRYVKILALGFSIPSLLFWWFLMNRSSFKSLLFFQ